MTKQQSDHFSWTQPKDIQYTMQRHYQKALFLREAIERQISFPFTLSLKKPTSRQMLEHYEDSKNWIKKHLQEEQKQSYTVNWKSFNHQILGNNKVPVSISFSNLDDILSFLGKQKEFSKFKHDSTRLLNEFPELKTWILKNSFQLIKNHQSLSSLIKITSWITQHPKPGIYLRQLPLEHISTKFIEQHKKILTDWLDELLSPDQIHDNWTGITNFERRFGFKSKPSLVRLRILDPELYWNNLSDISMSSFEILHFDIDVDTIFVIENDITALSMPLIKKALVIFGRGYGFESLKNARFMNHKTIWYWGDIDTHGFSILQEFKKQYPLTKSFLMDENTLLKHKSHWVHEQSPTSFPVTQLNEEEKTLYEKLIQNYYGDSIRLEQEFISYDHVIESIELIGLSIL